MCSSMEWDTGFKLNLYKAYRSQLYIFVTMKNTTEACSHCGDKITHTRIESSGNIYCCEGCESVAEFLSTEGLDANYKALLNMQEKRPKRLQDTQIFERFLSSLDQGSRIIHLGEYSETNHSLQLFSESIHCTACLWLLEKVLSGVPGVLRFDLDLNHRSLNLVYNPSEVKLAHLLKEMERCGYRFLPLREKPKESQIDKTLLTRIAVSGFAFMNVMMLSVATYTDHYTAELESFEFWFSLYSMFLTLPIVTWAAWPFYKKAYQGLKMKTLHMDLPVSLGVSFAFIASLISFFSGGESYYDSVTGVVFFLHLGRFWSSRFERSAMPESKWLELSLPETVERLFSSEYNTSESGWIETWELKEGDIIRLRKGDLVPSEGLLLIGEASFDSKWLTGEEEAIELKKGDKLSSGLRCISDGVELRLVCEVSSSQFIKLKNEWEGEFKQNRDRSLTEKIVPYFTAIVIGLALFALFRESSWIIGFQNAAVVLVLSCPCALALAKPISRGVGLGRAKELGFLVRKPDLLEHFKEIKTVVFDKTGTLTDPKRQIERWEWAESYQSQEVQSEIKEIRKRIFALSACSSHPVSRSVNEEFGSTISSNIIETQEEYQLVDSQEIENLGLSCKLKKGSEVYSLAIAKAWLSKADWVSLGGLELDYPSQGDRENFDSIIMENGQLLALFKVSELAIEGVAEMLASLNKKEINIELLSGDHSDKVKSFVNSLEGIKFNNSQGEMTPEQKKERVAELSKTQKVMVVGDGFNDAGMLKEASVKVLAWQGLRFLAKGVDVMVLEKSWKNLHKLFDLAKISKRAEFLGYSSSLLYNVVALSLAFSGVLAPIVGAIAMPFSSASVIIIALGVFKFSRS